jgi:beta-galactosidase
LGVYKSTVDNLHFAFNPPSENGGHEDARWLVLTNNAGDSIKIEGCKPFHFDAHKYTVESCNNAKHDHEIIKCKETILHIDAAHSPIGSNMAWSTVMPKDSALKGGYYTLDFRMTFGV